MNKNERLHALHILTRLLTERSPLSQLMPASAEVSPMTKEICYGFCRHYFRLQAMANLFLKKKPKETEIWVALLMGIYQLHYMQQPDYAVVKETVALLEKIKKSWAKGLVNAVLRNFCRQQNRVQSRFDGGTQAHCDTGGASLRPEASTPISGKGSDDMTAQLAQDPQFLYGQPQWLLERLQADWPQDWQKIVRENDAHPPMTLRVNVQKNAVNDYLKKLQQAGMIAEVHPVAPEGITLTSACDVHKLPGFAEGCVSIQDGAAQLAASLLSLTPGLRLLDACCAPGGKTCHILEKEPNLAMCLAMDVDSKRLNRVRDNLSRLGLEASLIQGDALNTASWWDGKPFDRILLDAPCSATGVIRRHSDIKLLRNNEEIDHIIQVQQQMLHSLWPLLAQGGLLVYATCSIIPSENEQQIAQFVAANPDCEVVNREYSWGRSTGHGQQILPGEHGMDGFFYATLTKVAQRTTSMLNSGLNKEKNDN